MVVDDSRYVPVILHINSSLSPAHTWAISEGLIVTAPELSLSIHSKNPKLSAMYTYTLHIVITPAYQY